MSKKGGKGPLAAGSSKKGTEEDREETLQAVVRAHTYAALSLYHRTAGPTKQNADMAYGIGAHGLVREKIQSFRGRMPTSTLQTLSFALWLLCSCAG